jgi:hypothetical protein
MNEVREIEDTDEIIKRLLLSNIMLEGGNSENIQYPWSLWNLI